VTRPAWSRGQWFEVWYRWPTSIGTYRVDRRRRSLPTAERLRRALLATGNYADVWLVEVNRF